MDNYLSKTRSLLPSLAASAVLILGIGYHATTHANTLDKQTLLTPTVKSMQVAFHGHSRACCVAPRYYYYRVQPYYYPTPVFWPAWGPFYGYHCSKTCYINRHGMVTRCVRSCY